MNDLKIKYYDEEIDIFNEVLMVSKTTFTATLSRIPSNRKILISHGYTSLTEVDTEPNINEFKVDRNTGEILFNSAMAGEKLIVDYHAIGKFCVSADNVSTNVDSNGNVIETLEGYLQKNKEIIDSVNTIGDGATVFNQLEAHIESAKNLTGNIIEGGTLNDKLVKTINNGKNADNNLKSSITSANNKITEMNEWVDQHGDIVNLDNRVDGVEAHIPKINEQLETKAKQTDLKILENRMNSFTSLNEGSTTGDAELMDGRNGADGKTYSNIGEAIRKQMIKKQDAILEYDTIPITLENGLYNNVNATINTGKTEWKHTKVTIEKDVNYKISCRGASGEYSSIVGIDSIGGRYIILSGNNSYIKDYLLKSSDIEKYVSLVINTSDTNTSPIIVKKSKQIDIIKYIDDKVSPLEHKKTMLCNANGNACKIRFKYSETKDCIILFTDYVNNCFKPSHIYLIDNVSNEIVWDFSGRTSDTLYTFINSEWISPYKNLNAINNPITSVTDQWTGGSHSIDSIKTNNIKSVKVYCDDVEVIQNVDTKCNGIKIICITEVTASNTTATVFEDNRYVLLEKQVWEITPNIFDVNVSFEFLEDCSLGVNYGLQTENSGFTKLRHYGDSANLGLVNVRAYAYGSNKTVGIANGWCLKDDNGNTLEVLVDTAYKCGNRCLIKPDTPTIVTADYGKTYSYIISEASFKTGDIVEHRGQYKFYCAN